MHGSTGFFFSFCLGLVTLLALPLAVIVPRDCMVVLGWIPHPDFLVFLTEGGERTLFGVEGAAMI